MDLTEHYLGLASDVAKVYEPLDREVDVMVTYGMYPTPNKVSIAPGIMVVTSMRSALLGQWLNEISVIYGPRPTDANFRDMVKVMVTKLKQQYDALLERSLTGPQRLPIRPTETIPDV